MKNTQPGAQHTAATPWGCNDGDDHNDCTVQTIQLKIFPGPPDQACLE